MTVEELIRELEEYPSWMEVSIMFTGNDRQYYNFEVRPELQHDEYDDPEMDNLVTTGVIINI